MRRIKFYPHGDFRNTLNAPVDEYFETTGLDRRGHGSYSKYPHLNRLIFFSLDFLGGSSGVKWFFFDDFICWAK